MGARSRSQFAFADVFRPISGRVARPIAVALWLALAAIALLVWVPRPALAEAPATVEYLTGPASSFDRGHGWSWQNVGDCGETDCTDSWSVGTVSAGDPPESRLLAALPVPPDPNGPSYVEQVSPVEITSPEFTYNGVDGRIPERLSFGMEVRQAVLPTAGGFYRVEARTGAGPKPERVILLPTSRLRCQAGCVDPWVDRILPELKSDSLAIGRSYRIVITLWTENPGPAGWIEFDDVRLTATGSGGVNGGENPGTLPTPGGGGNGDGDGKSRPAILPPPKLIPAGVAYLYGNRLFIRIRCPRAYRPTCKIRAVALTKRRRGKAMTGQLRKTVRQGTWKRGGLLIRKRHRLKLRRFAKTPNRRTVTVRLRVRSKQGRKRGAVHYRLKVRTRRG